MEKKYKKGELTVLWKPDLCVHSGKCVNGLPEVFRPKEKPWIQTEHASEDRIRKAVLNCPSGALSIEEKEARLLYEDQAVRISFVENGPVMIHGPVALDYLGNTENPAGARVVLCRCGASEKKPYCDGSHKKIQFKD